MRQTMNGLPATYALDTASGLTQVLEDNDHTIYPTRATSW